MNGLDLKPTTTLHSEAVFTRWAAKVQFHEHGCWQWTAKVDPPGKHHGGGYGRLRVNGRMLMAHRVAYEMFIGPVPEGQVLDHLCHNPGCVNPAHLQAVSQRENILRGDGLAAKRARKTHCPQGHPYDLTNTYWGERGDGKPFRQCRICMREQGHERYLRHRNPTK